MATQSEKIKALEEKYAQALETIKQLSNNNAALSGQVGLRAPMASGQLVVGIRNVSNYTVGFIDKTTGTPISYSLNPETPGSHDPKTRAVVSYAFWQQLRVGRFVGQGLIVRDDTILGPADNLAPEDRPQDVHPDAQKNIVANAREWILNHNEPDMRQAIAEMTSEPSLRRIIQAVDQEVWNIGESKYADDEGSEKARKSMRDLPGVFRVAEELAYERLDELNPMSKYRDTETAAPKRYNRN